jgi:hypothetical protein
VSQNVAKSQCHFIQITLFPQSSSFENESVTEKLERYKLSGIDEILADFIQVGNKTSCFKSNRLIHRLE